MKRIELALALALGLFAQSSLTALAAPESTLWFDIRNNSGGIQSITAPTAPFTIGQGSFPNSGGPGGGRGNGDVLRLCPMISNNMHLHNALPSTNYFPNFDGDSNAATGDLNLFCDVLPDLDSPTGMNDVMTAIGVDITITGSGVAGRYTIAGTSFSWNPALLTSGVTLVPQTPVAGGVSGQVGGAYLYNPWWNTINYSANNGLTPGGPYLLGTLRVSAASRTCNFTGSNTHANQSTYSVNLSVNGFGVTRAFQSGGNAIPEERVSLGYTGGSIEPEVSGNVVGGAGVRDAVIQVRMKNDSNGSGHVNTLDISGFLAAQAL